jgi:hypothetical protein
MYLFGVWDKINLWEMLKKLIKLFHFLLNNLIIKFVPKYQQVIILQLLLHKKDSFMAGVLQNILDLDSTKKSYRFREKYLLTKSLFRLLQEIGIQL